MSTVPKSERRGRGGWRGRGRGPARVQVRSRIALIAAAAVGIAVLLVAGSAYLVARHDLLSGVDARLDATAARLSRARTHKGLTAALAELFHPPTTLALEPIDQVVSASGIVLARSHSTLALPTAPAVPVAQARRASTFTTAVVGTTPVRILATGFGKGLALELGEPVAGIGAELNRLAIVLAIAAAAGVVLAVGLGAGVAGLALAPVRRLTAAAEEVAETSDLNRRIPVEGNDELSRLASSINTLLAALQNAQHAQRQLVADASHELRTPLTSLRTNVELLTGRAPVSEETRRQLVEDVTGQLEGIGELVGDLIELARQEASVADDRPRVPIALDGLVDEVLGEMRRLHREVRITQELAPVAVAGVPADLERVVKNLVDNAAKWSPPHGVVAVDLNDGPVVILSVSDQGPGIDARDLPHVFDRFFRGSGGQRVPGSGLGLAIVRRIVEVHGGDVEAGPAPGGGSRFVVRLPPAVRRGGPGDGTERRPPDVPDAGQLH